MSKPIHNSSLSKPQLARQNTWDNITDSENPKTNKALFKQNLTALFAAKKETPKSKLIPAQPVRLNSTHAAAKKLLEAQFGNQAKPQATTRTTTTQITPAIDAVPNVSLDDNIPDAPAMTTSTTASTSATTIKPTPKPAPRLVKDGSVQGSLSKPLLERQGTFDNIPDAEESGDSVTNRANPNFRKNLEALFLPKTQTAKTTLPKQPVKLNTHVNPNLAAAKKLLEAQFGKPQATITTTTTEPTPVIDTSLEPSTDDTIPVPPPMTLDTTIAPPTPTPVFSLVKGGSAHLHVEEEVIPPPPSVIDDGVIPPPPSVIDDGSVPPPPSVIDDGVIPPPPSVIDDGSVLPPPSVIDDSSIPPPPPSSIEVSLKGRMVQIQYTGSSGIKEVGVKTIRAFYAVIMNIFAAIFPGCWGAAKFKIDDQTYYVKRSLIERNLDQAAIIKKSFRGNSEENMKELKEAGLVHFRA